MYQENLDNDIYQSDNDIYQNNNDIFHRIRTNNSKTCMNNK